MDFKKRISLDSLQKMVLNERNMRNISKMVKIFRKDIDALPYSKKINYFQLNPNAKEYFKDMVLKLQDEKLILNKNHADLVNLLFDIQKLDNSLFNESEIKKIIQVHFLNIQNIEQQAFPALMVFFSKFPKSSVLISKIHAWMKILDLKKFTPAENINIMNALLKFDELSHEDYNKFNEAIFLKPLEITLIDVSMLSTINFKRKDSEALISLADFFLKNTPRYRDKLDYSPRDITEIYMSFTLVYNKIPIEFWNIVIEEFLLPKAKTFTRNQDIAQIFRASYRIKPIFNKIPEKIMKSNINFLLSILDFFLAPKNKNIMYKENEQDISWILFSSLNLKILDEKRINLLIQHFMKNIDQIMPIGIGYCLHTIYHQHPELFNGISNEVFEYFLKKPEKITVENIGYMLWILKNFKNSAKAKTIDAILEHIINKFDRFAFNSTTIDQFFYSFNSLQTLNVLKTNQGIKKVLISFLQNLKSNEIKEIKLISFSTFFQSLAIETSFNFHATDILSIKHNLILLIKESISHIENDFKGLGTLVYNLLKTELNDKDIWFKIKEICNNYNFKDIDFVESIYMLNGVAGFWGSHSDTFEMMKYKFYNAKLKKLTKQELHNLLKDPMIGPALLLAFPEEMRDK